MKARINPLTTLIQHHAGSFSQRNKARKKNNKMHIDRKGKLFLLTDDIIVYVENAKKPTKKKINS